MQPLSLLFIAHICCFDFAFSREEFNRGIIIITPMTGRVVPILNINNFTLPYGLGRGSEMKAVKNVGVYYHCPECKPGDYLIVYENTSARGLGEKQFNRSIHTISGFVDTGLKPSSYRLITSRGTDYFMVYPTFYAEIYRNDEMMKFTGAMNLSNWMENLESLIGTFTIPDLFIPGTHQSGAYERPESDGSWTTKAFVKRWTICQNTTILEQLYNGIRYLDIRPACEKFDGKCRSYYVHHGNIEMMPMEIVVDGLNHFLTRTREIVILSLKEFGAGFENSEDHDAFMKYLQEQLGQHIFPKNFLGWSTPLSTIWAEDKRLIITYDIQHHINLTFWPFIPQLWCDKTIVSELYDCIDSAHYRFKHEWMPSFPRVDMVQLTHNWKSIAKDILGLKLKSNRDNSIRGWADLLTPSIVRWYSEKWRSTSNIVAVDFFETTGIVELAIHLNNIRAREIQTVMHMIDNGSVDHKLSYETY